MNIINTLQELIKVKEELHRIEKEARWQAECLDKITGDVIEFLKDKRLIETKTAR